MATKHSKKTDPADNLFRTSYILKRALDEYGNHNLAQMGFENFNVTYIPFFMNIGTEGISNNEVAEKMRITKQGASRIIRELEATGIVKGERSDEDGRSVKLYLTPKGKEFQDKLAHEAGQLKKEYIKAIGRERYEIAMEVLDEIIAFHENKAKEY